MKIVSEWTNAEVLSGGSEIVVGNLGLPSGMEANEFEFNTGALSLATFTFGHFEQLNLTASNEEEERVSISPGNANPDGTATKTGSATVTKVKKLSIESDNDALKESNHIRNGTLSINANNGHFVSKNSASDQYDLGKRAKFLDKAYRQGIQRATTKKNLTGSINGTVDFFPSPAGRIFAALNIGFDSWRYSPLISSLSEQDYSSAATTIAIGTAFTQGVMRFIIGDMSSSPDILYSARPIKALAATAIVQSNTLVRPAQKV